MRIRVAAVGRLRDRALRSLIDAYYARLPWAVEEREVEVRQRVAEAERQAREGNLLLGTVTKGSVIVALDPLGGDLTSEALAQRIGRWRDGGAAEIAFLIGGADGHAAEVKARASDLLAFGRLTWPHMLVRLMLAEQLYRASTILAGHPYHRA